MKCVGARLLSGTKVIPVCVRELETVVSPLYLCRKMPLGRLDQNTGQAAFELHDCNQPGNGEENTFWGEQLFWGLGDPVWKTAITPSELRISSDTYNQTCRARRNSEGVIAVSL